MKTSASPLIFLSLLLGLLPINSPCQVRSLISLENKHLVPHLDNAFWVVAQQETPVSITQLSATIQIYGGEASPLEIKGSNTLFFIHPDTVGMVEISIDLGDTIEVKRLRVKTMEAKGYLSKHTANQPEPIKSGEFNAQSGIAAILVDYNICASCIVVGYEVIRISSRNEVERTLNIGARFSDESEEIILKATSGDLFIFRKIKYRCPGDRSPQSLDDMIFEIK
ncbi:MAG TPA: GldM family protein [Saprospiraceae bacterium]|nr:GldM family protein [Saprospiraceae bacterium]HMQ82669.1 GldM family protein [Saprospiraceae bacterium]